MQNLSLEHLEGMRNYAAIQTIHGLCVRNRFRLRKSYALTSPGSSTLRFGGWGTVRSSRGKPLRLGSVAGALCGLPEESPYA